MGLREDRLERLRGIDLYPVITGEFCAGRDVLEVLRAAAAGGVKIAQLREKRLPKRELFELATAFRAVCDEFGVLMIVDDELDIAMASGADGVHLGQDDLPLGPARLLAPELLIGHSTHSIAEAVAAHDAGADYINLGPIYPTATKDVPCGDLGVEIIEKVAPLLLDIPFTVMGGIKERHIPELLKLGARHIAMVTEVTQAEDVEAKVRQLRSYWMTN
jgi:thiamine-phosphate pyrophosphorylase